MVEDRPLKTEREVKEKINWEAVKSVAYFAFLLAIVSVGGVLLGDSWDKAVMTGLLLLLLFELTSFSFRTDRKIKQMEDEWRAWKQSKEE